MTKEKNIWFLHVLSGHHRGAIHPILPNTELLIGSNPACDIVLSDPGVSANHYHLQRTEDRLYISPLKASRHPDKFSPESAVQQPVGLGAPFDLDGSEVTLICINPLQSPMNPADAFSFKKLITTPLLISGTLLAAIMLALGVHTHNLTNDNPSRTLGVTQQDSHFAHLPTNHPVNHEQTTDNKTSQIATTLPSEETSEEQPNHKLLALVEAISDAPNAFLRTQDQSIYYPGSRLPDGSILKHIEGKHITLEKNGQIQQFNLAEIPSASHFPPIQPRLKGSISETPRAGSPAQYRSLINKAAQRYRLNPKLIAAIIHIESSFDPYAVSDAGAMGLMQLMPETAAWLGVSNPMDSESNIMGGCKLLRWLLDKYHNNLPLTLAAYNAGPKVVARYNGIPPYPETRKYVAKVLNLLENENTLL